MLLLPGLFGGIGDAFDLLGARLDCVLLLFDCCCFELLLLFGVLLAVGLLIIRARITSGMIRPYRDLISSFEHGSMYTCSFFSRNEHRLFQLGIFVRSTRLFVT